MSRSARVRLVLLCEDVQHRRFLEALCDQWDIDVGRQCRFEVAPKGRGDAKAWIRARYGDAARGEARLVRSKNFQPNLGLLVMIDGDDRGHDARKRELDDALASAGLPRRGEHEPIAVFAPTWSIETWLLWLWGDATVDEAGSYKEDGRTGGPERAARYRAARDEPGNTVLAAVRAWSRPRAGEAEHAPALADARRESHRLPQP